MRRGPGDPSTEAWAAVLRGLPMSARGRTDAHRRRRGRAEVRGAELRDADARIPARDRALLFAVTSVMATRPWRVGSASGKKSARTRMSPLRCVERSLVAMTGSKWDQAEALAAAAKRRFASGRDCGELRHAPGGGAVQARAAMHRGDVPAARQQLVSAQRLRHLLTYALPYLAVQARIELIRVHLALTHLAGARTLMREVDELPRRRPGVLVGRFPGAPGPAREGARFKRPRSVVFSPPPAAALHAPVVFPRSPRRCPSRRTPSSRRRTPCTGSSGASSRNQAVAQVP